MAFNVDVTYVGRKKLIPKQFITLSFAALERDVDSRMRPWVKKFLTLQRGFSKKVLAFYVIPADVFTMTEKLVS